MRLFFNLLDVSFRVIVGEDVKSWSLINDSNIWVRGIGTVRYSMCTLDQLVNLELGREDSDSESSRTVVGLLDLFHRSLEFRCFSMDDRNGVASVLEKEEHKCSKLVSTERNFPLNQDTKRKAAFFSEEHLLQAHRDEIIQLVLPLIVCGLASLSGEFRYFTSGMFMKLKNRFTGKQRRACAVYWNMIQTKLVYSVAKL